MAQTNRPQSAWSPPPQAQSPDAFLPPAKRQRLSPDPSSPYTNSPTTPYTTSPSLTNIALPNGAFGNSRPNGVAPQNVVTTPGSVAGVMGPPQRPAERAGDKPAAPVKEEKDKAVDINELNDLVASSGVNLKDEEEFLNASYRSARYGQQQAAAGPSSFDLVSQNRFGNLGPPRSTFAQSQDKQTEEEELYAKHKKAARLLAESTQLVLDNPFLWGNSLRRRMQAAATEYGLGIPIDGLWDRIGDAPQSMSGAASKDSAGHGIQVTRAPSLLTPKTPLDPMISLISLAGNERVRGLLEDAYSLARGRQAGADGVVPPEWADIAVGEKVEQTLITPRSISGTAWDAVDASIDIKSEMANGGRKKPESVPTTAYSQSKLNIALNTLTQRDRAAEEARLRLRETRRKKKAQQAAAAVAGDSTASDAVAAPAGAAAPAPIGERAPEVKMTKKEREKAAKLDISEEVAAREANATATMQIGGKVYSWMARPKKSNALPKPAAAKPSTAAGLSGAAPSQDGLAAIRDRKYGTWREDGVGAQGVQLRDWIGVLEQDGREKKTLLQAYVKLDGLVGDGEAASLGKA